MGGETRLPQLAGLVADAVEEVLAVARGDEDPDMRRRAIHQLGAMDAGAALRERPRT